MGIAEKVLAPAFAWAKEHLSAAQVCWVCIAATVALFLIVTNRYATASDVRELALASAEKEMIDIRFRQCNAAAADKRWIRERLAELLRKYQERAGKPFSLPECGEL